jgi:hypothetical protein
MKTLSIVFIAIFIGFTSCIPIAQVSPYVPTHVNAVPTIGITPNLYTSNWTYRPGGYYSGSYIGNVYQAPRYNQCPVKVVVKPRGYHLPRGGRRGR